MSGTCLNDSGRLCQVPCTVTAGSSVGRLQNVSVWLFENSWLFMSAILHHPVWECSVDPCLEDLLRRHATSTGSFAGAVSLQLLQGAFCLSSEQAKVLASGPADMLSNFIHGL